jgi:hypothetical protein
MQYATYFSIPSVNTLVFADKWTYLPPRWEHISERAVGLDIVPMASCCWPRIKAIKHKIIFFLQPFLYLAFCINYAF